MIKMTQPYQKARGPLCCMTNHVSEVINEQECIPVGCIPSATVAVSCGEGVCRGVGFCPGGGISAQGSGCLPRGVPRRRGVCPGDVCRG